MYTETNAKPGISFTKR